jgi:hypothetical protein
MKVISSFFLLFILLVVTLISENLLAQDTYNLPHNEHRPYHQLQEYPRGYNKDSMLLALDVLLNKPARTWSNTDSLDYLFTLIAIEEFDSALENFNSFRRVNPRNMDEFHLIQFMFSYKRVFDKAFQWLDREKKEFPESKDIIDIRIRLHKVEEMIIKGTWHDEDSIMFPMLQEQKWDKIRKGSEDYLSITIPLIRKMDIALRDETKFEFNVNRALAIAFFEFGIFLEKHLSTTDAFIALSIARYYDKFNTQINEKYREVRSLMNKRKFIFPSMREIFPKQNKGIFNIENIKKRRQAEQDSIVQSTREPIGLQLDPNQKKSIISDQFGSLVIFTGLILLLIYVAVFVRTKN